MGNITLIIESTRTVVLKLTIILFITLILELLHILLELRHR